MALAIVQYSIRHMDKFIQEIQITIDNVKTVSLFSYIIVRHSAWSSCYLVKLIQNICKTCVNFSFPQIWHPVKLSSWFPNCQCKISFEFSFSLVHKMSMQFSQTRHSAYSFLKPKKTCVCTTIGKNYIDQSPFTVSVLVHFTLQERYISWEQ